VKEGVAPSEVIKSYGLCRTTIYKWLTAERRGGEAALAARKHPGRRPTLAPRQKLQVRGWLNGLRFVELLAHFMRGRKSPVFLVLDGHPAHIAKVVAQYVQRLPGRLELHFLPGYAPELNPDEFVWNHLKRQGVSKIPLRRDESLRSRVQSDLSAIQSHPALVRSFFHAPSVAYTTSSEPSAVPPRRSGRSQRKREGIMPSGS
jgi:transposase